VHIFGLKSINGASALPDKIVKHIFFAFLFYLTIKYGIFEQISHTVIYGHCERVHMMCLKCAPFARMHALSLLQFLHHWCKKKSCRYCPGQDFTRP